MADVSKPRPLDEAFAQILRAQKADFVAVDDDGLGSTIAQHGAATIDTAGWPGWPRDLHSHEPIIETFLVTGSDVQPTSTNEPFVSAWLPLATWLAHTVRRALDALGVSIDGDAFVTASLTSSDLLEGTAHMDDDGYIPGNGVGAVAIIGQHTGPRVATGALCHAPVRAMSQVVFDDERVASFEARQIAHVACDADQLVIFPQFGQLHAGPAAADVSATASRQLLVYRARVHARA